MIVDFAYYTEVFEGTAIPEQYFKRLSKKAERFVNYATCNQADTTSGTVLETVKECICEIAEQYQIMEKLEKQALGEGEKVISSESVGSWSVSYDTPTKTDVNTLEYTTEKNKRLYSIVKEHLAFTGLLYRGVS